MTPADALKLIAEKEAKFADLRFTDTIGKEQHVTIPTSLVDEGFFSEGKMFDGSSIAGWKGINESDMILLPDASTAVIDPFFAAQRWCTSQQERDLHAQAVGRRQWQRHARAPVARQGGQEYFCRRPVCGPVGNVLILHWRYHQTRQGHQRVDECHYQQLQTPGAGLRGAGHAGILGAQSFGLDSGALGIERKGAAH